MTSSSESQFDRTYFEDGVEQKVSCYENYRWIPELTIPLAHNLVEYLGIKRVQRILDFGCAKGYLVYAFHLLGYLNTYGYDISAYAIENSPSEIERFLMLRDTTAWGSSGHPYRDLDFVIAKDVLEHLSRGELAKTLKALRGDTEKLFAVIPLGREGRYLSERDNLDVTHEICESSEWWLEEFRLRGFTVKDFAEQLWFLKNGRKGFGYFTLT